MIDCEIIQRYNMGSNSKLRLVTEEEEGGEKIIVKKEFIKGRNPDEYNFYIKFGQRIKKDGMNKFISIPKRILNCRNSKIYIFPKYSHNYSTNYIKNIEQKLFIDYTIQLCLQVYYINHKLKMFHNDLIKYGNLWNVMIDENSKPLILKSGRFKYQIMGNIIRIIDFGRPRKFPAFVLSDMYKFHGKDLPFISEVFLVFFLSFKNHNNPNLSFREFYKNFIGNAKSLKEFDINIINSAIQYKSNFPSLVKYL